jgi:hypothetical protein
MLYPLRPQPVLGLFLVVVIRLDLLLLLCGLLRDGLRISGLDLSGSRRSLFLVS